MDKGKFIKKTKQLAKEDFELDYKAKQFLSSIHSSTEEKEAVSALIMALSDLDINIRLMSACTLSKIAPHTSKAVVTLIKALRDEDPRVRFWAIRAIRSIGPYAKEASKTLEVMLKDDRYKSHHKEIETTLKKIKESLPKAYCMKCRAKREMKNPRSMMMKNRRPATQAVCPVCGTKLFRIGKGEPVARIDTIELLYPMEEEPSERKVPPRYVNTCFAHRDNEHTVVKKNMSLAQDTWYDLRIDIGPLSLDSVVKNPKGFPFPEEQLPPTRDGHWLEIGAVSAEFKIPQGRHHLFLPKIGPSWVCNCIPGNEHSCNDNSRQSHLFIPIQTPSSAGKANLRLEIYYKKNLVQSQKFTVEISIDEQAGKRHYATIDYTLTDKLRDLDYLPPRTLNIAHNQNRDRTHTLIVNHRDDDIIGFTVTEGQMEEALDCVRTTLRNIHFEESGGTLLLPEVHRENRYDSSNVKPIGQFKKDLRELAEKGFLLYSCLFGNKPTTEEKLTESLKNTVDEPPTIQISRTGNSTFVFPWDLLYDIPLEVTDTNEFEYCDLLNKWDESELSSTVKKGIYRCPYQSSHRKNTVCPFGFWGFKYAIEQPPFVEDRPLPVTIQRGEQRLEMLIGLSSTPAAGSLADKHIETVRGTLSEFQINDTEKTSELKLKMRSPHLDIIYFFGHGRYETRGSPGKGIYLEMADGHIKPQTIKTWTQCDWPPGHWQQNSPLVLLNGCHTAELTPRTLVSFVDMFARAYASGLIGTEITIAEQVAIEAAEVFLSCFNDNKPVKTALNKMRKQFLSKGNLLGLVYTAYCSMDLKLRLS